MYKIQAKTEREARGREGKATETTEKAAKDFGKV